MSPRDALRRLRAAVQLGRDVWSALFDHPSRETLEALHATERAIEARQRARSSATVIERDGGRRDL